MAARSVLAGVAKGYPKSGLDNVEMIRRLKIVKSSAIKPHTQAMNQMKALIVTAPLELRTPDWRQLLLPVGVDQFCRFSSSC